jgi:hypothetical protein
MAVVTEMPKKKSVAPLDDYEHTDADDPRAPPKSEYPKTEAPALLRLGDILLPSLARAEQRRHGAERPVPVPFPSYAEALGGGFWAGCHSLVAGTGAGKSAFMLQVATHAAQNGVPVLYVGLELSGFQVALRALGEASGASWSRLYTGRASDRDMERAREAIPELGALPFFVELNTAQGWPPSNMIRRVEELRKLYPAGPLLVVLDFLQLVGAEAAVLGPHPDLRERIGRAAYAGVHVANTYHASVVLISSSARDKYALLAGDTRNAGFTTCTMPGHVEAVRTIMNPDALMGLGKESGEIEFSAESQTVLVKWPVPLESGERAVLCAVPKLRYGAPRWLPLRFWTRFDELPHRTLEELPQPVARSGRPARDATDRSDDVINTVRGRADCTSVEKILDAVGGNRQKTREVVKRLIHEGRLAKNDEGRFEIRTETPGLIRNENE